MAKVKIGFFSFLVIFFFQSPPTTRFRTHRIKVLRGAVRTTPCFTLHWRVLGNFLFRHTFRDPFETIYTTTAPTNRTPTAPTTLPSVPTPYTK